MALRVFVIGLCAGVVALQAAAPSSYAAEPTIVALQADDGRFEAVEVRGLDPSRLSAMADRSSAEWQRVFAVYVGEADSAIPNLPPILGDYVVNEFAVRFAPRFPFSSGLRYRARFNISRFYGADTAIPRLIEHAFTMPTAQTQGTTVVSSLYPTTASWPANTLKFYVHFSHAMKRGGVYHNIRLIDNDTGEAVDQAFVETEPELWDPSARRVTVLFHPGRIKRGLAMHGLNGPPLEAGHTYTIVVDGAMVDANGQPLASAFHKTIETIAADRSGPDPATWKFVSPPAATREPLTVSLDEPIDRALLDRFLTVVDGADEPVPGRVRVGADEREWSYVPDTTWSGGRYTLLVSRRLEDLAGNTPGRAFEVREGSTPAADSNDPYIRLGFDIR